MRKEYDLKKLVPKKKDPKKFKDAKVSTNVRIDLDVVAWLREESEKLGIPYQTLMNSKLKQSMKENQTTIASVTSLNHRLASLELLVNKIKKKIAV